MAAHIASCVLILKEVSYATTNSLPLSRYQLLHSRPGHKHNTRQTHLHKQSIAAIMPRDQACTQSLDWQGLNQQLVACEGVCHWYFGFVYCWTNIVVHSLCQRFASLHPVGQPKTCKEMAVCVSRDMMISRDIDNLIFGHFWLSHMEKVLEGAVS